MKRRAICETADRDLKQRTCPHIACTQIIYFEFCECQLKDASFPTCAGRAALHLLQCVHVALTQPFLVGLPVPDGHQADCGVLEDQVGTLVALRVKHAEAHGRVVAIVHLSQRHRGAEADQLSALTVSQMVDQDPLLGRGVGLIGSRLRGTFPSLFFDKGF